MPRKSPLLPWMAIGCAAMLAGCNTSPQSGRISELKGQYDQMTPATQAVLAKGSIERGHTPEMVYIALGRPDLIETSPDGQNITWTYRNFYPSAKIVKESLYQTPDLNPLQETMAAWRVNLQKHNQLDNNRTPKRDDQTWADYESKNPAQPNLGNRLQEQSAEADYLAQRPEIGIPDRDPMKLDVIFHHQRVIDAIINDTTSAFAVPK